MAFKKPLNIIFPESRFPKVYDLRFWFLIPILIVTERVNWSSGLDYFLRRNPYFSAGRKPRYLADDMKPHNRAHAGDGHFFAIQYD